MERLVSLADDENLKDNDRLFSAWTRAKLFDDVGAKQKIMSKIMGVSTQNLGVPLKHSTYCMYLASVHHFQCQCLL